MKCNKSLPLLIIELRLGPRIGCGERGLLVIDFNALGFYHYETSIDTFDFSYQLLL